jgi:hypothetical protein
VFSDKTGTLTDNIMVFHACSIDGVKYHMSDSSLLPIDQKYVWLYVCMYVCMYRCLSWHICSDSMSITIRIVIWIFLIHLCLCKFMHAYLLSSSESYTRLNKYRHIALRFVLIMHAHGWQHTNTYTYGHELFLLCFDCAHALAATHTCTMHQSYESTCTGCVLLCATMSLPLWNTTLMSVSMKVCVCSCACLYLYVLVCYVGLLWFIVRTLSIAIMHNNCCFDSWCGCWVMISNESILWCFKQVWRNPQITLIFLSALLSLSWWLHL